MLESRNGRPKAQSGGVHPDSGSLRQVLSISIIGPFAARCGDAEIKLKTRKACAVLAYLALSETRQESRERLVGFLWSRSDEMKARTSLRQILHDIRQAFARAGFEGLHSGKLALALEADEMEVDLWQILQEADRFRAHPLLLNTPQLTDRLCEGLDDLDPSFRVWIIAKRQTILDRLLRSLNAGLASPNVAASVKQELAAAILNLDPTHEEACRYAMEARAVAGDVAGALRLYKALWDLLDQEYAMEPGPETQDLVARVKLGEFDRPSERTNLPATNGAAAASRNLPDDAATAAPALSAARPFPRIALLLAPFEMNGVGPDKLHLVSGFRHHLAACLVRFREWSVIDNGSASFSLPPGVVMSAQYSLDATAYQAGPKVNMVLTLRENTQGLYVWSESFELTLKGWFEAQQRVIRRLASSLNVQLSTERLMRLSAEPDVSLETYDRWLRGQALLVRFDPASWKRASKLFADATRDSPDFSPIHSSIVQMDNIEHFVHPGVKQDILKIRETLARAKTAVQLDPVDSRAHMCLGWSHMLAQNYDEAAPHMELARELNDNDPGTLVSTAAYWAFCGEAEKSVAQAREAMAMSIAPAPFQWGYYAIILFLSGDYAGALEAAEHAQDVIKTLPAWRAAALFHLGRREAAAKEARRFLYTIRTSWYGRGQPSDPAIVRWLLHAHPIRWRAQWESLRDGVAGASIPTDGIEPLIW
ncbi:DNA-binding transcriptional activator of the SARP family [Rhizobiales bacterium GAS191]|nr:DNA-binding transcriptional activator of the SARP family [Rhizobiales bacterium GAS113]SED70183.1 DNA-binding transcriptional activator of the SARP family [Rhizobiales bacterium GAS191]